MDDALEMLGPGFEDGRVRAFAVQQLARADDEVGPYLISLSRKSVLTAWQIGIAIIPVTTGTGSQV
jgi:hypothetical protein